MPTLRELAAFDQWLEIFRQHCKQEQMVSNDKLREAFDEDCDPRCVAEYNDDLKLSDFDYNRKHYGS